METTNTLLNLSPATLRRAADLKERIDTLNSELASIIGRGDSVSLNPQPLPPKNGRRQMSAAGRARIAAAARARWAKIHAAKGNGSSSASGNNSSLNLQPSSLKRKRRMSAAGRAKIAAAAKARWAKAKAAGKTSL
jgi:hypothetical protein